MPSPADDFLDLPRLVRAQPDGAPDASCAEPPARWAGSCPPPALGVVHDLNNLLLVVQGNAGLAAEMAAGHAELAARLRGIDTAARTCSVLLRLLLADLGVESPVPSIGAAVRSLEPALRLLLGGHLRLEVDVRGPDAGVAMTQSQLLRILWNLALNAREAAGAAGVLRIVVAAELACSAIGSLAEPSSRSWMVLRVSDDGPGMERDVLERLARGSFSTKHATQRGVGLAVVRELTAMAGGTVAIRSAPGCGSEFRIRLPVVAPGAQPAPAFALP